MSELTARNLRSRGAVDRRRREPDGRARRGARARGSSARAVGLDEIPAAARRRPTSSSPRRARRASSLDRRRPPARRCAAAAAARSCFVDLAVPRDVDPGARRRSTAASSTTSTTSRPSSRRRSPAAAPRRCGPSASSPPRRSASGSGRHRWRSCRRSPRCAPAPRRSAPAELAKAEGRLGRLPESERKLVESVTSQIVDKLLHLPTVRMKEAAAARRRRGLC